MLEDKLNQIGNKDICATAIVIKNGSILSGLRHYTPNKWKVVSVWTTPGGRCDDGETLEQTLRREILEEVNIGELDIVEFLGEVPGAKDGDSVYVFVCRTNEDPTLMEPEKFSEWKWVPVGEYVKGEPWNIMNPEMHRMIRKYFEQSKT
jgi:8-oxo-dGTP pyrophosphatase MutT (NUDIX family)